MSAEFKDEFSSEAQAKATSVDDLKAQLGEIVVAARAAVAEATSTDALAETKAELLGRSSHLAALRSAIGSFNTDDRPEAGRACNEATDEITTLVDARHSELAQVERTALLQTERADLTEIIGDLTVGHSHIITQTRRTLEDLFVGMGYTVADGPEIDTEWHNFTALNFPLGHPARDMYDTLYVNWGKAMSTMLRTHTSPVQVRTMTSQPPPIAVVAPGRCFRRDTADATHMPVFHQIEGLLIDRNINLGHLAGTIEAFTTAFFGEGFSSRLRPSYFPFTEPSAEFDIQRPDGSWLELGGCGMVHPNVLEACGIDPEEWTGFAFGFGIDRLAMIRYGVDDLRDLWLGDMRFLRQF